MIPNISANMILSAIKDALLRLNIGLCRCRGQCYDGASNMSGCRSGVAKLINDMESRPLYTHCYGQSLNLAVGDTVRGTVRCNGYYLHMKYAVLQTLWDE